MKPELLALGTKVQLTGIISPRYGYINSYSASSDHPYLVKTDDGLEVLCNDNDINVVSYIVDRNAVPTKNPKFEKGQIVFYQESDYNRQVVVVNEVDAEVDEYHVSYVDVEETTWVEEHELSEILDTSDCLDSAILNYQDLSKSLVELHASIELLEKELHKQRSHNNCIQHLIELAEQDVLVHARGLGDWEED